MSAEVQVAHEVCQQIVRETHDLYLNTVRPALLELAEINDSAELGPSGYDPLFGPPFVGAEIFFIGFQPGGGPNEDCVEEPGVGRPLWPEHCVYATANWKLARVLQGIYSIDFLLKCTGSERQFYRAANDQVYAAWPRDLRLKTENFSLLKLRQMIEVLRPKKIVFIGKKTIDALLQNYAVVEKDRRGHFRLGRGVFNGIPAMGCAHLSGAWLTGDDLSAIANGLQRFAAE